MIVGAGASGLMLAHRFKDRDIALIDSNKEIGQKIKISGGGKCNITNVSVKRSNYFPQSEIVHESLKSFSKEDLLDFLKQAGIALVVKKKRYYFCQDSAMQVVNFFKRSLKQVPIYLDTTISSVSKENTFTLVSGGNTFRCKHLIIASGGLSYPRIGASGIAYEIAKVFDHSVVTPRAALVGLTVQKEQFWFKELSGISISVAIMIGEKRFEDDLLFTHKGISGPAVLNASLYWEKGEIEIDFLPQISKERLVKMSKKSIPLPKRFLQQFLQVQTIADLKSYSFAPAGNFGYSKAEVTRGGVSTKEIDISTMQSMKEKNLYFIGECVDVTGELGGYNFQWAFSSAHHLKLRG